MGPLRETNSQELRCEKNRIQFGQRVASQELISRSATWRLTNWLSLLVKVSKILLDFTWNRKSIRYDNNGVFCWLNHFADFLEAYNSLHNEKAFLHIIMIMQWWNVLVSCSRHVKNHLKCHRILYSLRGKSEYQNFVFRIKLMGRSFPVE